MRVDEGDDLSWLEVLAAIGLGVICLFRACYIAMKLLGLL